MNTRFRLLPGLRIVVVAALLVSARALLGGPAAHNVQFWRSIRANDFNVPAGESAAGLALEIVDLAAETDPVLRDECGYEILASWIYRRNLLSADQVEAVRTKLIPGLTFHIGESDNTTVFRRSFSALYMSVLAANDLQHPFLSDAAFHQTLETALQCYAREKDLRGYVPNQGWAHATAHVADLLKFLARNPLLSVADQGRVVEAAVQRSRTVPSVFVWGEDARIAAALLSVVSRKDFETAPFETWFKALTLENKELWKTATLDTPAYVRVRTQANVLTQLAAKMAAKAPGDAPASFRTTVNSTIAELN